MTRPGAPTEVHVVERESVSSLLSRLVEDVRGLAQAEVALQKARLGERITGYKSAIVFFAVAGVLALAALIALLVGLIMTLTPLVGPGFATLIVVVAVLTLAAVLGLIGKSRLSAIGRPEPMS